MSFFFGGTFTGYSLAYISPRSGLAKIIYKSAKLLLWRRLPTDSLPHKPSTTCQTYWQCQIRCNLYEHGSTAGNRPITLSLSVYTADCRSSHTDSVLVKYADDTALTALITDDDDTYYRQEIDRFVQWCGRNYFDLHVGKAKKMVIDFRRKIGRPEPAQVVLRRGGTLWNELKLTSTPASSFTVPWAGSRTQTRS